MREHAPLHEGACPTARPFHVATHPDHGRQHDRPSVHLGPHPLCLDGHRSAHGGAHEEDGQGEERLDAWRGGGGGGWRGGCGPWLERR